jgi:hypothetical protein
MKVCCFGRDRDLRAQATSRLFPISTIALWGALLLIPSICQAQETRDSQAGKHELNILVARSFANGHVFGFAQDRSLTLLELGYGRQIFSRRRVRFHYLLTAVPIAVVSEPLITQTTGKAAPQTPRDNIFGAGASPIGLEVKIGKSNRAQGFLKSNGGFLYLQRALPGLDSTRFNFTVNLDGGVSLPLSRNNRLRLGYRYHHLSNANRGQHNPGLDSHMIIAAWSCGSE